MNISFFVEVLIITFIYISSFIQRACC